MTTDAKVGRRVHQLMWDRHLTNRALAARLGLDESALSRKMRGGRKWTVDELLDLSAIFDVPVADLLPEPELWAPRGSNPQPTGYRVRRLALVPDLAELLEAS